MRSRRLFLKRMSSALGMTWVGYEGLCRHLIEPESPSPSAFTSDAPEQLGPCSRHALHYERQGDVIICRLCPHACVLSEGDRGFCRARVVRGGRLHTVSYGNLCALALDPIEKKPLYHFMPQSPIASIAMGGCNLRCPNCQNWQISQSRPQDVKRYQAEPQKVIELAQARGVPSIAYTYTEPLVGYEYVLDCAKLARNAGLKNVLVTAGYVNEKPLAQLLPYLDAVQLDVKAFDDEKYRQTTRGRLDPILRNLVALREGGVWLEVSFLMVSQLSDEPDEVGAFAHWMAENLGVDVPLHLLRFHPAHRLTHLAPTPISKLSRAHEQAQDAGLRFVYVGNVPGLGFGVTRCPHDGDVLIERRGYHVQLNRLEGGACPKCGERIAGVFEG
ncbi:MAG: AmmeMemoRadiSam system radical SAM enzyme [Sorangium cellulosum]|nr:MAG: AmmeMemoRadiSam system radical SAM enzyme [Sorangium cellulosum]